MNDLESVKEIWDTLKMAHKYDKITKIMKMDLLEEELRRFAMNKGQPQEMYIWLKSLVNQVHNYGSNKWTDHEVIRLMLRSFTSHNATLFTLICENSRYEKMNHEEVLGKFLSHEMMVKYSKHNEDLVQGNITTTEPQPIALKGHKRSKGGALKKRGNHRCFGLEDEKMSLIIKSF